MEWLETGHLKKIRVESQNSEFEYDDILAGIRLSESNPSGGPALKNLRRQWWIDIK